MRKLIIAVGVAIVLLASTAEAKKVTLSVLYEKAFVFKDVHNQIANKFMQKHPDVKIKFLAPADAYEECAQIVLRGAITGNMPDVSYQGHNRVRIFVDRDLVVPLDEFIKEEKNWAVQGYSPSILSLGRHKGKQYGLAFAVSTPIIYANADLVRKAGGDPNNLPKTWDDVIELARKIDALGDHIYGLYFDWSITGNWLWQALVFSHGGTMLTEDEKTVAFDGKAGVKAINILDHIVTKTNMPNITRPESRQSFAAGTIGLHITSTSQLGAVTRMIGDKFELKTSTFPLPENHLNSKVPAGGNMAVIHTKDPKKQKAAWEYIKFATGKIGSTYMVKATGYMAGNELPPKESNLLGKFYEEHPNYLSSVKQLPIMTQWYAFPGKNGLKITDVIKDHLQRVVTKQDDPQKILKEMTRDVQKLLPNN